jgi:hypothetical protein
MERPERIWIIAWAALMGFALLLLHNWVVTLDNPAAFFGLIWPLYVIAVSLPLTLQMLSAYRTQKALWLMTVGFCLVMAGAVSYSGQQVWVADLSGSFYDNRFFQQFFIVTTCWFILMPFAEHRLLRQTWWSDYTLLFSATWRNTVKLSSAAVFIGLFWGLLLLWAQLFKVLKVNYFYELFTGRGFIYPMTGIAYGIGLSLYSAKEDALAGIYRASLNVLGWLLPLVTFIILLFLLSLLFLGLEPLWKTGFATSLMLALLGLMVFLFNAAWQDAEGIVKFPGWLKNLISVGLVFTPLYIVLCAYSLSLRISQYGWSVDRLWASLAVLEFSIYTVGYAVASVRRKNTWMHDAKIVNIAGALLAVTLLFLTCTPLLDPARIAVNSQIDRLLDGKVEVNEFDFDYLRFEAGKYGNDQLKDLLNLSDHPQAERIHAKVESVLQKKYRSFGQQSSKLETTRENLLEELELYPRGTVLDDAFVDFLLEQLNGQKMFLNRVSSKHSFQILAIDLNDDEQVELILFTAYQGMVFGIEDKKWKQIGLLNGPSINKLTGDWLSPTLKQQDFETLANKWRDIRIGNERYSVTSVK